MAGVYCHREFRSKRGVVHLFWEIRLDLAPVSERDPIEPVAAASSLSRRRIQPRGIENIHGGIALPIGGRSQLYREVQSNECSIRPIEEPSRYAVVLHQEIPLPFCIRGHLREELRRPPAELDPQLLIRVEKTTHPWRS